jgi:hypothetical protein
MSLNPFANTANTTNESIETDSDRLGGSFIWDSAAVLVTILSAYAGKSKGGAGSMNLEVQGPDGRKFKFTEWVTSGDAKGNKPYYEKDGKKSYLPGFNNMNAIAMFCAKKELNALTFETKIVKLRNFDTKTDVPTEVPMATELLGKQFILGVVKVEENKTKKVSVNGKDEYLPVCDATGAPITRFTNEVSKIFYADNKCTIAELREAKQKGITPVADFYPKWVEANEGKVVNKVKSDKLVPEGGGAGPAGTPTDASGAEVDSLFD